MASSEIPQPTSTDDPLAGGMLARLARLPRWLLVALMALTLGAVVALGAAVPATAPPPTTTPSVTPTAVPTPSRTPSQAPGLTQLAETVRQLETTYQASIGVAISPVFSPSQTDLAPWRTGTLRTGPAWATIDVPIAVAVETGARQPNDLPYLLTRAFTDASGAGDQALWQFLGDDATAADATSAILRAGGDHATVVPVGNVGEYPVFTRTFWALGDQATWFGALYCMPNTWQTQVRLFHPPADAVFGLARLPNAMTKTSWGTGAGGSLSMRQAGIVAPAGGGPVAVSLAVVPLDADLATARAVLDNLASAVGATVTGLAGRC